MPSSSGRLDLRPPRCKDSLVMAAEVGLGKMVNFDCEASIDGSVIPLHALSLTPTDEQKVRVENALEHLPKEFFDCPDLQPLGVYFLRTQYEF